MSGKKKLSAEEKISLMQKHQVGEIGYREAVTLAGGNRETFRRWVKRYEAEGVGGFLPYERNRVYSDELKLEAVLAYLSEEGSQATIAQKYYLRSERQLLRHHGQRTTAHKYLSGWKQILVLSRIKSEPSQA